MFGLSIMICILRRTMESKKNIQKQIVQTKRWRIKTNLHYYDSIYYYDDNLPNLVFSFSVLWRRMKRKKSYDTNKMFCFVCKWIKCERHQISKLHTIRAMYLFMFLHYLLSSSSLFIAHILLGFAVVIKFRF